MFEPKDFLDHIYHDKRALYLRVLAHHLSSKTDTFAQVSYTTFRGDVYKPILTLIPQKSTFSLYKNLTHKKSRKRSFDQIRYSLNSHNKKRTLQTPTITSQS
jgi:hypothetical protein